MSFGVGDVVINSPVLALRVRRVRSGQSFDTFALTVAKGGTGLFRAFVDSAYAMAEANEDNNQFIKTYRINNGAGDNALFLE